MSLALLPPPTRELVWIFPQFCQLPVELQLKIYRYTFPRNRVIELQRTTTWEGDSYTCLSDPPPSALQICQASRHEALLAYHKLSFPGPAAEDRGLELYLNPHLDTIYISPTSVEHRSLQSTLALITTLSACGAPLALVRSLAIEDGILLELMRAQRAGLLVEHFPRLCALVVVSEFLYQAAKAMGRPTQAAVFDDGVDYSGMRNIVIAELAVNGASGLPPVVFMNRRAVRRRRWRTSGGDESSEAASRTEDDSMPAWLNRSLPRLQSFFSKSDYQSP